MSRRKHHLTDKQHERLNKTIQRASLSDKEIAKKHTVSLATVTRHRRMLKTAAPVVGPVIASPKTLQKPRPPTTVIMRSTEMLGVVSILFDAHTALPELIAFVVEARQRALHI